MTRILIAPDKFKGSLTAFEVSAAIQKGIGQAHPNAIFDTQPMADGGDGSIDLIHHLWQLTTHEVIVNDPLFRPVLAKYYTGKGVAFIELSKASGLALLHKSEQNCLKTTTLGTGELIADAIQKGFKNIKLFIGGSATNDAGMGIAMALGYLFLDKNGETLLPIGGNLNKVVTITSNETVEKYLQTISIQVVCDVNNPFFGKNGAAHVYAPQKGANVAGIDLLDKGLQNLNQVFVQTGFIDVQNIAGAGAAGGVGGGMIALFNAEQIAGIQLFVALFDLEEKIKKADIVITGEGRVDTQSFQGKVLDGIFTLCQKHEKPLMIICGQQFLTENDLLLQTKNKSQLKIFQIMDWATSTEDAIKNASDYLQKIGKFAVSSMLPNL